MPQKPHNGKAFHFCQQICLLLATCSSVDQCCQSCNLDTSYLAYDSSIVRKRRPARRTEVADATPPPKQRPIAFEIARGRTAKHKKYAFTCDSGATISVCNRLDIFETIDDLSPKLRVKVANGSLVTPSCTGTVRLNMVDAHGTPYTVLHKNVHYSANFSSNLLSVHEMYKQHKISTVFRGSKAFFTTPDDVHIPIDFTPVP